MLKSCCLTQHSQAIFEATIPAGNIDFIVFDVESVETDLPEINDLQYCARQRILADYLRIKIKNANHCFHLNITYPDRHTCTPWNMYNKYSTRHELR